MKKVTIFKKISYENIVNGIFECFNNANRLYNDSEILFRNNKYESACFLVTISLEELGKIPIFINSFKNGSDSAGNYKINRDELQGLNSHCSKITNALHVNYLFNNPSEQDEYNFDYIKKTFDNLARAVNKVKKYSLYISYKDGRVYSPSVNYSDLADIVQLTFDTLNIYYNYCYSKPAIKEWLK